MATDSTPAMRVVLTTLHSKYIHSSLALACLASICQDIPGCDLSIQEYTVHEPKDNVLAAILAARPHVVAFSVYIWNRSAVLELADAMKVAEPGILILLGGPEIGHEDETFFRSHPGVGGLVRGEGEGPLREILDQLSGNRSPAGTPGLLWHQDSGVVDGGERSPLEDLDAIPSPFEAGLVDLERGFVYYETSRGCPFSCMFCMSALENRVRSYSMKRIRRDLDFLMSRRLPKIKLVDRTFNYDAQRARKIFAYILDHNRVSHFHFEIGAALLDDETIRLLSRVPRGMFQFEIGVQSCSAETLKAVGRHMALEKVLENIARLREETLIDLHLDLVAGLPQEGYARFMDSLDRTLALRPHHLQIELVKILPGSLLRREACCLGMEYDPHPPYTVLKTPELGFVELNRLRCISRMVDVTYNSGCFQGFLAGLKGACGSFSRAFERMADFWEKHNLFRHPLQRCDIYANLWRFVQTGFDLVEAARLTDLLARDYARSERVVPARAPAFFDTALSANQSAAVSHLVREETLRIKGQGIKVQYFAAVFRHLPDVPTGGLVLFLYLTGRGRKMCVKEMVLNADGLLLSDVGNLL